MDEIDDPVFLKRHVAELKDVLARIVHGARSTSAAANCCIVHRQVLGEARQILEEEDNDRIARFMELEAMDDDCEDQACTEMPTHCLQWQCRYNFGRGNKAIKLVNRGGFMCCPQCGGSYGASVSAGEQR